MLLAKWREMPFGQKVISALLSGVLLLGVLYLLTHRYETHLGGPQRTLVFMRDTWTGSVTLCPPSGGCRRLD